MESWNEFGSASVDVGVSAIGVSQLIAVLMLMVGLLMMLRARAKLQHIKRGREEMKRLTDDARRKAGSAPATDLRQP